MGSAGSVRVRGLQHSVGARCLCLDYRWLAQRKTRDILGAVFMVLIVGLLAINSVWNQKRYEGTKNHKEEAAPLREALDKYAPLLRTANLVQQWLPPGLSARTLQRGIEQKPVAGFASLNMLGLWVVLAGGALAGRLKAQYRGQNLSWASSRTKLSDAGVGGHWVALVPLPQLWRRSCGV